MAEYQANIYPGDTANPTVSNADPSRKSIAVCFSGGGSRALTCAWGQLLGLSNLQGENGQALLDEVRYISSVSGGTWASVLYTFRPESFTDAEFLGNSYPPSQLYYNQDKPNTLNVSKMAASALGKIPQNFANLFDVDLLKNILAKFITITVLKEIPLSTSAKWLWMYIVGENVLADFGLYTYENSLFKVQETPWQFNDAKFFSLSKTYAASTIFSKAKAPPEDAFVYARTNPNGQSACPMLIINTNVVGKDCPGTNMAAPIQIPLQVSAVAAGVYGANPCTTDGIGGGSVESFGFTSNLSSLSGTEQVTAEFSRAYMLSDIAACSSAFYAATLVDPVKSVVAGLSAYDDEHLANHFARFVEDAEELVLDEIRNNLSDISKELENLSKESLVPQYNYWPASQVSGCAAANQNTKFTDGGDLENTGVAGLLAQLQGTVSNIIAFVNGDEVLEQKNGQIIAATQMAPLYGIAYNAEKAQFKSYLAGGINPFTGQTDPLGFLQVFDNSHAEFDALRQGLFAANGAGANTDAAFCLQTLDVVKNELLGITQTNSINILWVQNAQVNNWQNKITDTVLKKKIEAAQKDNFPLNLMEFSRFPYYSTFLKIHQTAAETNALAQMWAWCVCNEESPLSAAITKMFANDTRS